MVKPILGPEETSQCRGRIQVPIKKIQPERRQETTSWGRSGGIGQLHIAQAQTENNFPKEKILLTEANRCDSVGCRRRLRPGHTGGPSGVAARRQGHLPAKDACEWSGEGRCPATVASAIVCQKQRRPSSPEILGGRHTPIYM